MGFLSGLFGGGGDYSGYLDQATQYAAQQLPAGQKALNYWMAGQLPWYLSPQEQQMLQPSSQVVNLGNQLMGVGGQAGAAIQQGLPTAQQLMGIAGQAGAAIQPALTAAQAAVPQSINLAAEAAQGALAATGAVPAAIQQAMNMSQLTGNNANYLLSQYQQPLSQSQNLISMAQQGQLLPQLQAEVNYAYQTAQDQSMNELGQAGMLGGTAQAGISEENALRAVAMQGQLLNQEAALGQIGAEVALQEAGLGGTLAGESGQLALGAGYLRIAQAQLGLEADQLAGSLGLSAERTGLQAGQLGLNAEQLGLNAGSLGLSAYSTSFLPIELTQSIMQNMFQDVMTSYGLATDTNLAAAAYALQGDQLWMMGMGSLFSGLGSFLGGPGFAKLLG